MDSELQVIRQQLEALKRETAALRAQVQRGRRITAACCIVLSAGLLVAAQQKPKPAPVEGSEFVLKDPDGRSRGGLSIREGEATLELLGGPGAPRISVSAGKDVTGLFILDEQARKRGLLAMDKDGRLALQLFDQKEVRRIDLGAGKISYGLRLYDQDAKQRVLLSASKDGGALMFGDKTGADRASFGEVDGQPTLSLTDEKGRVIFSKP